MGWYESGIRKSKALPNKALADHFHQIKYTQLNSEVFTGNPNGKHIVSGSFDDTVKVWDASNGKALLTMQGAGKYIFSVTVSPNGKRILAGNSTDTITEWDAATGEVLRTFTVNDQAIIQDSNL